MSLRIGVLLIAIGALAAAECPALAASQRDWDACISQDPDTSIAGCTRILDAGDETPKVHSTVYNARGVAYKRKGDYDRAIADYDEAIRLDPNYANAYSNRGNEYVRKGDYDRAIADCDEAIRLDPEGVRRYFGRGGARFYAGAVAGAVADFQQATVRRPADAYAALWLEIAERRGGLDGHLAQTLAGVDMTKWPAPVIQHFLGEVTLPALLAAADDRDPATRGNQVCEANFYAGELSLLNGDRREAERLFRLSFEGCPHNFMEYDGARFELAGLAAEPTPVGLVPAASETELVFWNSVKDSTSLADFEAYLASFPNGVFAALARNRLAALKRHVDD